MEPYTINTDSWHYRIRTEYGGGNNRFSQEVDFCNYTRDFLFGCLLVTILIILGGILAGGTADMLLWLYFSWQVGEWLHPNEIFVGGVIVATLGTIIGAIAAIVSIKDALQRRSLGIEKHPSFLTMVYRKFKNNVCFRINFEE